jgi:hypothetical protein
MKMRQIQLARFEYEVMKEVLNLYDRGDVINGESILTFRAQVDFDDDLEVAVRNAVNKNYRGRSRHPSLRIQAKDLNGKNSDFDYVI